MEIHLSGQYLYVDDRCIKFDSEEKAEEFLSNLVKEMLK